MVLGKMLMAVRREAQVEKALRRPQAEGILKMVTTIKNMRQENDEECTDLIKSGKNKKQQPVEISIRAREGKQGGELPEKVIDCVVTSK